MQLINVLLPAKALSSFLECEVPVVVSDRYDFEFSKKKELKENVGHKTQLIKQEIEVIDNQKFLKSYQKIP